MALVDLRTNLADWSTTKKKPSEANPAPVNFFDAGGVNASAGATGFTKNFDSENASKFLGISNNNQSYTYPATVRGNRLMKPRLSAAFPGPQNFISNSESGATGFTKNADNPERSKFLGVASNNQSYTYPATVRGNRLMQPTPNVAKFPGPQNFISDSESGVKGFRLNADNPEQSAFIGVTVNNQGYVYPSAVLGNRLMKPKLSTAFPGPQNFISDSESGVKGFRLNADNPNQSDFIGVASNNQSYTYPTTVLGNRLMKPTPTVIAFPGPQNFISDPRSGVKEGFRLRATDKTQSAFLGIDGTSYTYPESVQGVQGNPINKVPLLATTGIGTTATFDQPIGGLKVFRYSNDKDRVATQGNVVKLVELVANSPRRYEDRVKSVKDQSSLSPLYTNSTEQNSPSAITEQYTKFHLTDESYNPTYLAQPYIIRGIQRLGDPNPQRWGFGLNFDDGLVPAGTVAYGERIGADVARIAQFIASPKGLLWTAKQAGLQLSNPLTENPGVRVFNPIQLVANVATAPLGIRIQRHGLIGVTRKYGDVIQDQTNLPSGIAPENRLEGLLSDYGLKTSRLADLPISELFNVTGQRSIRLSGLGGPQSVYGIGETVIRRTLDTSNESVVRAERYRIFTRSTDPEETAFNYRSYDYRYAGQLRANTNIDSDANDSDSRRTLRQVDGGDFDTDAGENFGIRVNYDETVNDDVTFLSRTPGAGPPGQKPGFNIGEAVDISSDATRRGYYAEAPDTSIARYLTMTYSAIPKSLATEGKTVPNDFRNALEFDDDRSKFIGKTASDNYYETNNLETKYGFGALGKVGEDRTTARGDKSFAAEPAKVETDDTRKRIITANTFRGDKVTALDVITSTGVSVTTDKIYPEGANDLIEFYFEDGNQGVHVMPFRATITGLSDSFSPGWNDVSILGYPQGASMYSTFSRTVSFSFIVAATSRSEMIPMWRKLNYLATYTMPDYKDGSGNSSSVRGTASGPFMRLTLGDLYRNAPGFLESLSYTIPEDSTWDIADDRTSQFKTPKQLPTVVEVSISYRIVAINDRLPEKMGRAYNLDNRDGTGDWLPDSLRTEPAES